MHLRYERMGDFLVGGPKHGQLSVGKLVDLLKQTIAQLAEVDPAALGLIQIRIHPLKDNPMAKSKPNPFAPKGKPKPPMGGKIMGGGKGKGAC